MEIPCFEKNIRPEDDLLVLAGKTDGLGEMVEKAHELLSASVVVADSLHYLLALSSDLLPLLPEHPEWMDLINAGIVPPVRPMHEHFATGSGNKSLSDYSYGENLLFHVALQTDNGQVCTMCDIKDEGITVVKLAVTTKDEPSAEQLRLIQFLAMTILLSYQKFHVKNQSDPQSKYLLNLLTQEHSESELPPCEFFRSGNNYKLYCFDTENLRRFNLSFLPIAAEISKSNCAIASRDDHYFVILTNCSPEFDCIYQKMLQMTKEAGFPIIESIEIAEWYKLSDIYRITKIAAEVATEFRGTNGIFQVTDFSLFLLFERIIRFSNKEEIIHPDALSLMHYDEDKNAELCNTVFAYLLYNKEAPTTADALYIHRNTLDKRLKKVESIISPNWRNISYEYAMLVSLYQILKEKNNLPYYQLI